MLLPVFQTRAPVTVKARSLTVERLADDTSKQLVLPERNVCQLGRSMAWLSSNALISINVVTLCWTRLIFGWVTISGWVICVTNQLPMSTQPSIPPG